MRANKFSKLIEASEQLTLGQRRRLLKRLEEVGHQQTIVEWIEPQQGKRPVCPYCKTEDPIRWGRSHGLSRFRCRNCKRTFNALTSTPLAHLRHKEQWPVFAQTMIEGKSVRASAQACGVHYTTTFRWRHRFLRLPEEKQAQVLRGIAEADETFLLRSKKGERGLQRRARKRGGKATKPGRSSEQVCVLVARDRGGATVNHVLSEFTKDTLVNVLQPVLAGDTLLCSDGHSVYKAFAAEAGVVHKAVNVSAGIRVVEKVFHIQNVNAYHSRFKTWIRRFNGVATKYLPNYLGWYRWLDGNANALTPQAWFLTAVGAS